MANRPGLITEMSEPRRVLWTLWKNFEDMSFTRDAGGAALEAFTLIQAGGPQGLRGPSRVTRRHGYKFYLRGS
jgi:hypothetical protein